MLEARNVNWGTHGPAGRRGGEPVLEASYYSNKAIYELVSLGRQRNKSV